MLFRSLFGVSEVLVNVEKIIERKVGETKIRGLLPSLQDWKDSIKPILRGSFLGFFLGTLPGGGALISSFASYAMEKKLSKHPERFGKGAIEGVLCRGGIEIKRLQWNKGTIEVSLVSKKSQKIVLEAPSGSVTSRPTW